MCYCTYQPNTHCIDDCLCCPLPQLLYSNLLPCTHAQMDSVIGLSYCCYCCQSKDYQILRFRPKSELQLPLRNAKMI